MCYTSFILNMISSVLLRSEQQQQSKPDQVRLSKAHLKMQRKVLMDLKIIIFILWHIYINVNMFYLQA